MTFDIKDTSSYSRHDPYPDSMCEKDYDSDETKRNKRKQRWDWDKRGRELEALAINVEIDKPTTKTQGS